MHIKAHFFDIGNLKMLQNWHCNADFSTPKVSIIWLILELKMNKLNFYSNNFSTKENLTN